MHDPIFLPVPRPSWEDKNPGGIYLPPSEVLGELLDGGSWAASGLQSAVPKGGADAVLRAASPVLLLRGGCRCHGTRGEGSAEQPGRPRPAGAPAQAAGVPGTVAAASSSLRGVRVDRQPQGLEAGRCRGVVRAEASPAAPSQGSR